MTKDAKLTSREREVLRLLTYGHTDSQIAQELSISKATVRRHVQHIYGKLGVSTRAAATRVAILSKLV